MSKKIASVFVAIVLCATAALWFACDDPGKCTEIGQPADVSELVMTDALRSDYGDVNDGAGAFAGKFASSALDLGANSVVSPASVYLTLALASVCAGGKTGAQISDALGVDGETLMSGVGGMMKAMTRKTETSTLEVGNSVWLAQNMSFERDKIDELSQKMFAYSYKADFAGDNRNANLALRHFVKEATHGSIRHDFDLDESTMFVLLNVLYLKDTWTQFGKDLDFTDKDYTFKGIDGDVSLPLLVGEYKSGKAYRGDGYTSFFTSTYAGYRVTFLLPDDGVSLTEVMSEGNITDALSRRFVSVDDERQEAYFTRCLFPEFSAQFDGNVADVLKTRFGITHLFDSQSCDLSPLLGEDNGGVEGVHCAEIRHLVKFKADKKGIEGAAVSYIPGATSPAPPDYKKVYADFVVDRAFGFVVSYDRIPLFVGSIGEPDV